ncbi:hypothetical protein AAFF_G00107920 [Aldrovandia affinis]|uniref:Uncharacterized protein n=1 Tax=Aldrovandia affinis TaxID=143900 RepID=A0AAD7RU76_9TELE|nr:hypothetical protein AAFF_G00107920 [Aldrovandia affinis]
MALIYIHMSSKVTRPSRARTRSATYAVKAALRVSSSGQEEPLFWAIGHTVDTLSSRQPSSFLGSCLPKG